MKKVMLLGAGSGQLPFLNICKSKGYYVIVVSIRGNYPCFEKADKSYFVDTRDKETILEIARREKIDAILTDQTDVSVPTVAYVAEKMGLRGIGYETALKFTNKYLMRQAAKAAGVAVPDFDKAATLEEATVIADRIGYPVVIKPVDSSGSRGVIRLDSAADLAAHFQEAKHFSLSGEVIIEQFICGSEFIVNGYSMDYMFWNLDIGEKEYFKQPGTFVPSATIFSSVKRIDDGIEQTLLDENFKLVKYLQLSFGIVHGEYLYNKSNRKVYLIEIAARGGATFISSDLTPLATGFDINEAVIDYAVEGKKIPIDIDNLNDRVSARVCFGFDEEGVVIEISGLEECRNIEGVYRIVMDGIYVGAEVTKLRDDTDRYGPILIQADSEEECREIIRRVRSTLKVKIQTADGIKDMIW